MQACCLPRLFLLQHYFSRETTALPFQRHRVNSTTGMELQPEALDMVLTLFELMGTTSLPC